MAEELKEKLYIVDKELEKALSEIVVYSSPKRCLFDWRDSPLTLPVSDNTDQSRTACAEHEEAAKLDSICQDLLRCPSVQAMVRYFPAVSEIPVFFEHYEEDEGPYGTYSSQFKEASLQQYQNWLAPADWQVAVAGHEFRHGWHHDVGVLIGDQFEIWQRIALVRGYEADCVVFQITVAAELREYAGDERAFNALLEMGGYNIAAKAFDQAIRRDPKALLNGKAQRAAYFAYLQQNNLGLLSGYDGSACDREVELRWLNKVPADRHGEDALIETLQKLFYMPYLDPDTGALVEREHYNGLKDLISTHALLKHTRKSIRNRVARILAGHKNYGLDFDVTLEAA